MSGGIGFEDEFFRDVQLHNPWWAGELGELEAISELEPRSNTYKLLYTLDESLYGKRETRLFPQYGQRGIGKTTTLKHVVATCLDDPSVGVDMEADRLGRDDLEIESDLQPEQILYLPVEESLFHIQATEDADTDLATIERVGTTIERFSTRHEESRELVLVDDLGVLNLEPEDRFRALGRYATGDRAVVTTGTLRSHVSVPDDAASAAHAYAHLPRKFIDVVKMRGGRLATIVGDHQADEERGHIHAVRDLLDGPADGQALEAIVDQLETFCFDVLAEEDRRTLDRLARQYFRHGGFFESGDDPSADVRELRRSNELISSAFQLLLYRDVADAFDLSSPRNLHKLCAYAARDHDEYTLKELASWLGVDRRTVKNRYLEALDEATILNPAPDFGVVRQHRTRLHLQNPKHAILLSQRQAHRGFEPTYRNHQPDPTFERLLARTVAFDHAKRLQFAIRDRTSKAADDELNVEYTETEAGYVDAILRHGRFVYPVALAYGRSSESARAAVQAFDPSTGKHRSADDDGGRSIETVDTEYTAPLRFVVEDSLAYDLEKRGRLSYPSEDDESTVCHVPLWLFLLLG